MNKITAKTLLCFISIPYQSVSTGNLFSKRKLNIFHTPTKVQINKVENLTGKLNFFFKTIAGKVKFQLILLIIHIPIYLPFQISSAISSHCNNQQISPLFVSYWSQFNWNLVKLEWFNSDPNWMLLVNWNNNWIKLKTIIITKIFWRACIEITSNLPVDIRFYKIDELYFFNHYKYVEFSFGYFIIYLFNFNAYQIWACILRHSAKFVRNYYFYEWILLYWNRMWNAEIINYNKIINNSRNNWCNSNEHK